MRRHRSDIDDRAAAGLDHRRNESLADQDRADQVVLGQGADVRERNVERVVGVGLAARGTDIAAGAVDQDMHLAEPRVDLGLHPRDRIRIADVAGHGHHPRAVTRHVLLDGGEVLVFAVFGRLRRVDIVDYDVGTLCGKLLGHQFAQPASRSGNERGLADEFSGHSQTSSRIRPRSRMFAALRRIMSIS